jgi:hypothetical protein
VSYYGSESENLTPKLRGREKNPADRLIEIGHSGMFFVANLCNRCSHAIVVPARPNGCAIRHHNDMDPFQALDSVQASLMVHRTKKRLTMFRDCLE